MTNRTYTIIDIQNLTTEKINDCLETSIDTLFLNVDKTKAILKWDGENPSWVADLGLTTYSHEQIMPIIQSTEWSLPGWP